MITEIANTDYYNMAVDLEKNRCYLRIQGFWGARSNVPHYLGHCQQLIEHLQPGFTAVVDLTHSKIPSEEARQLHEQAQHLFILAGLSRTAEVHPSEDTIFSRSFDQLASATQLQGRQTFFNQQEAEAWLDKTAKTQGGLMGLLKSLFGSK